MRKPDGYDECDAIGGGFRDPQAGPCILGIVNASIKNNRNGEQVLTLFLDIAEGEFKNHYQRLTNRLNKNLLLRYFQNTEGKGTPYFKGIISAIEESNQGFQFDWNESELIHKKLGGNLREEEYVRTSDGTIGIALRVAYLCSKRSILEGGHKVLPAKKLQQETQREPGVDDIPPDDFNQDISYQYEEEPLPF